MISVRKRKALALCMLMWKIRWRRRLKQTLYRRRYWRAPWNRKRPEQSVNCNLLKELEVDGASYRKYIHVDRCHFQDLSDRVAPFIAKSDTKFHDAISVEERLALTLRFLATGKHSFTINAQSSVYLPYWLFIFVFLV
jgi:hypothetical protein